MIRLTNRPINCNWEDDFDEENQPTDPGFINKDVEKEWDETFGYKSKNSEKNKYIVPGSEFPPSLIKLLQEDPHLVNRNLHKFTDASNEGRLIDPKEIDAKPYGSNVVFTFKLYPNSNLDDSTPEDIVNNLINAWIRYWNSDDMLIWMKKRIHVLLKNYLGFPGYGETPPKEWKLFEYLAAGTDFKPEYVKELNDNRRLLGKNAVNPSSEFYEILDGLDIDDLCLKYLYMNNLIEEGPDGYE